MRDTCDTNIPLENKYTKDKYEEYNNILTNIEDSMSNYVPCNNKKCGCHKDVIDDDLKPFKSVGINKVMFDLARSKGTKYQIISGKLYREAKCHFPARCSGVERYLLELAGTMPDMELSINTRDWPQFNRKWRASAVPIFSFSKTPDYYDIMYPAWSFWQGGPAIKLYPNGIGKWHQHRKSIVAAADKWPWEKKKSQAFFRGSRTSEERDALVLLSRSDPSLVDAQYTKNQAWKSDADTLHQPPASEVSFEDHCQYKYLFNYRGVAASFRFKHLFLCKSLVFHVGDEWLEFFYPSFKPWVHYVPVSPSATQNELKQLIEFFKEHDDVAKKIADKGFQHVWDNLTIKDVKCYWRNLLTKYAELVDYKVTRDMGLKEITKDDD